MRPYLKFVLAVLARNIRAVADRCRKWIYSKLREVAQATSDLLYHVREFARWIRWIFSL
jgi:hypothetical protein